MRRKPISKGQRNSRIKTPAHPRVKRLRQRPKYNYNPIGITRPSPLNLAVNFVPKYGYQLIPAGVPVYNYDEIQDIKTKFEILYANNVRPPYQDLMHTETWIKHKLEALQNNDSSIFFIDMKEGEYEMYIKKRLNFTFYGCHFFKDCIGTKEENTIKIALMLAVNCLGIADWTQMDHDYHLDYLKQVASEYEEYEDSEKSEKENRLPPELWYESDKSVCTNNGYVLELKNIGTAYKESVAAGIIWRKEKEETLRDPDLIEKIEQMLAKDTNATLFLKATIYLIMREFKLINYTHTDINNGYEDEAVPLWEMYCLYYAYDDFYMIIDDRPETEGEEPSLLTVLSVSKKKTPNPKVPHNHLFEIFSLLFSYNPVKDEFYEDKKHIVRTTFANLDIREWQSVLRRRIKSFNKRRMGLHSPAV